MGVRFGRVLAGAGMAVLLGGAQLVRGDVIHDWNVVATNLAVNQPAPVQFQVARAVAMMHVAMFDAVNGLGPRYTPYLGGLPEAPAGASTEAAAAAAAHHVLVRVHPARAAEFDAQLQASLAAVPEPARSLGVAYGVTVAEALCDLRESDKFLDPAAPFVSTNAPGDYQPTQPGAQPINRGAGTWVPFAMMAPSQFRGNGPPRLTSPAYARDVAEVAAIGEKASLSRTDTQRMIADWHVELVPLQINRLARTESAADGRDLLEHARLFALVNIAVTDAVISVFEAKYVYRLWRPVTAIRRADEDGNAATQSAPDWTPYLPTPMHPEYPSGHAVMQGAGTRILTSYFGPRHGYDATSPFVPGLVRHFDSFDAFVDDGADARVYGGIHFRAAVVEGARQGRRVGNWALDHVLTPLK